MPTFTGQVGNYPMALAKLEVLQSQGRQLCPSQAAADEKGEQGMIALAARCGPVLSPTTSCPSSAVSQFPRVLPAALPP